MRFILALCIPFLLAMNSPANPAPTSTVTIPVQEYLSLVRQNEKPRFVTILGASLGGRFGERLSFTLNGQASSLNEKREFLRFDPQNVSFENCSGDAQIAFDGGSASLLALAPKFTLKCDILPKNWGQVQFTLVQVMGAKADVAGAEALVLTDPNGDRQISVTKAIGGGARPDENLPVTAVGRFRISLLPENARFDYDITVENPARGSRPFEIRFANGESPSRVATDGEYTEDGGVLRLRLKPGSNSVRIEGPYTGANFKSPIAGGPHYLLIENHQLLQVTTESQARRVSARDAGLSSRFAGQRAFLLQTDGESVAWTTKKLDVLPALGFSVENADYNYFIPTRGKGVVEATFRINNQGQPEIPLAVGGRPLYLEVDGQPQVLATNPDGELLLQLTPGVRSVYVQYEAPTETRASIGFPFLRLAKPNSVMSQIQSRLSFEDGASLLWAQGLSKSESDLFDFALLASFVLFAALTYFVLAQVPRNWRLGAAVAAGVIATHSLGVALLGVLLLAVAALVRHRARLVGWFTGIKWTWDKTLGGLIVGGGLALAMMLILSFTLLKIRGDLTTEGPSARNMTAGLLQNKVSSFGAGARSAAPMMESYAAEDLADAPAEQAYAEDAVGGGGDYQGLPAKVVVPEGRRVIHFERGLIEASAPVMMFAAFVHPGVPKLLFFLALVTLVTLAYRERASLRSWLRLSA